MRFSGAHIAAMGGRDKDRATRMSSLANEEPLMVMKAGVDIVREVVRKDCSDSHGSVVRKGEASLRRGGSGSIREGAFSTENGDISCNRGSGGHWGSEVLASRRGDKDVVGVDGDVLVKWSKEESVEDFLGYSRRGGRHGEWG